MDRLLDISDVCTITGLKKTTIYMWIHKRQIPVVKLSRRAVRFRESDLVAFIDAKFQNPVSLRKDEGQSKQGHPNKKRRLSRNTIQVDEIMEIAKREARA